MVNKLVVCYDAREEKVRGKLRKALKSIGQHHQLSVFLTQEDVPEQTLTHLKTLLESSMDRLVVAKLKGKELTIGKPFESFRWSL